jgi:hypothetical protein
LLTGGSAGGVVLAALRMIREHEESSAEHTGRTAVAIVVDGGEKYLDTIHAPGWLEEHHLDFTGGKIGLYEALAEQAWVNMEFTDEHGLVHNRRIPVPLPLT